MNRRRTLRLVVRRARETTTDGDDDGDDDDDDDDRGGSGEHDVNLVASAPPPRRRSALEDEGEGEGEGVSSSDRVLLFVAVDGTTDGSFGPVTRSPSAPHANGTTEGRRDQSGSESGRLRREFSAPRAREFHWSLVVLVRGTNSTPQRRG